MESAVLVFYQAQGLPCAAGDEDRLQEHKGECVAQPDPENGRAVLKSVAGRSVAGCTGQGRFICVGSADLGWPARRARHLDVNLRANAAFERPGQQETIMTRFNKEPAEGSREVIDRELKRQEREQN